MKASGIFVDRGNLTRVILKVAILLSPVFLCLKESVLASAAKAQTGFLGQRYDNVAMVHIRKPPDQVGRDFFGSASDARRTDPGLTREGNGQAHFALGATQKSDPIVQVTTAKQLFEDTLSFSVKRPVGRLIATFVDLEERSQVVDENSPQ